MTMMTTMMKMAMMKMTMMKMTMMKMRLLMMRRMRCCFHLENKQLARARGRFLARSQLGVDRKGGGEGRRWPAGDGDGDGDGDSRTDTDVGNGK